MKVNVIVTIIIISYLISYNVCLACVTPSISVVLWHSISVDFKEELHVSTLYYMI